MSSPTQYELRLVESLDQIDAQEWTRLAGAHPFISYPFLVGLQSTGCTSPDTGWHPRFLLLHRGARLVGCAPCYFKSHSRGEFVFDQGWAEAFARHGLDYYPKLLVAAPFTPVQGPRLLAADEEARVALAHALITVTRSSGASSAHVLFVEDQDRVALVKAGFLVRESLQFHWSNQSYSRLNDFLASLNQDKRKKVRQDSKYVASAGIAYKWLEGADITEEHLRFFYTCYSRTYEEHWSTPYLSFEFFQLMHEERSLHFVLMLGHRQGLPVACALNVLAGDTLYGRYWGTTEFVRGLHFETCYLQGIAFCIERGIRTFEGGAQGQHKMARGLLPVKTYSGHWIADQRFATAIADFLEREVAAVDGMVNELFESNPYKDDETLEDATDVACSERDA